MTPNTRPEHTLLARQNRCLQSFRECSSAGISHSVLVEIEFGESGVYLVICHRTHAWLHACCRTPLNQRGQSFVCMEMTVRIRAMCVRLRVLLATSVWRSPSNLAHPATTHASGSAMSRLRLRGETIQVCVHSSVKHALGLDSE